VVSGALVAADNVITGISLKDDTSDENVPLVFTDNSESPTNYYNTPSSFSTLPNSGLFDSSPCQTFTLTVDVVNWDGSEYNPTASSTGFLLAGSAEAVAVPAPQAGWTLLVLIGGLQAWRACPKRFLSAPAIS